MNDSQIKSKSYWTNAQTTYLASEEYYLSQEVGLTTLLGIVGIVDKAIDLGCGDGRFTIVASNYCGTIEGVDINPSLIARARSVADHKKNVMFSVGLVEDFQADSKFDLILCMGVVSALIQEDLFNKFSANLCRSLRSGGWLITKDTLSLGRPYESEVGDYIAYYRNKDYYLNRLLQFGLTLKSVIELTSTDKTTNSLFLFRNGL